jgi:hypothetical protein
MSFELSNKNPGNMNNRHPNADNKHIAEKKRRLKNFVEKEKDTNKNKLPLFYTIPIFKPNNYEFY